VFYYQRALVLQNRHHWMGFHRIFQGFETENFKCQFVLWNDMSPPSLHITGTKDSFGRYMFANFLISVKATRAKECGFNRKDSIFSQMHIPYRPSQHSGLP
jgi:hypothetical protein